MQNEAVLLGLIPLFPLVGALVIGLMYMATCNKTRLPNALYGIIAVAGPAASFVAAVMVFSQLMAMPADSRMLTYTAFEWIAVGTLTLNIGFLGDTLSGMMILFVTFIGTLIHIYSTGYMGDDEAFGKFFAYLNLFLGCMLILVLADNPVLLFVGWEGVGLCSYLLISFYYSDKDNVVAGNKAFIVNRVGDFGFLIGMALLFWAIGFGGFSFVALEAHSGMLSAGMATAIALLLFVGATGKSAQIPLYVWLPDAMAGPTPVSALIHAATMVTAGVYMVARFSFVYTSVPDVGLFIAWIGILTALLAAVIATQQSDIKKILAYSTVSQLGYMFVGVGLGAYSAGIFHVFTHAFFKALLFLGAGAVIYALHHQQDVWKMGGLRKKLPITYITMLLGCIAIAGIPPFAGFFSKDEILLSAFSHGHYLMWAMGILTAGLTAYYMFRMFFLTFHGEPRDKYVYDHAHEAPISMTGPLMILSIGAVGAGWLGIPKVLGGNAWFHKWIGETSPAIYVSHPSAAVEYGLMALSVGVAVIGISIAYKLFFHGAKEPVYSHGWRNLVHNKFFVDEAYDAFFVRPLRALSTIIWKFFDNGIIDALVRGSRLVYQVTGSMFAVSQTGKLRFYAFYMVVGISIICLFMLRQV
ncbi:NADH-quinone oxidoreductase subunit L [Desulfurispirillum indicum]|uniref:Proton-translocating NADH-quinone oxidoreductase, chain L n=1 Tax=Desulfurispirillum indicum (strain ATCC BAA-1389 / DSM 22839 / S5) TaxID=653733 RepID=E6W2N6_DESIS|nr:NADH-quinone oxidoreductase subunit L [Desulfurispirillum indicum]ADU65620.1 proton-translocating NADH-quinone oxidoreductase, chain L [Desulfurispirillum indicum S5]UCZ57545.1 NADH-quinone oxidoreductase subunit L [Desulfurispirillum indicum]